MKLHQNKETNPGVGFIFLTKKKNKKKFKNKKGNKYLKFGGKKRREKQIHNVSIMEKRKIHSVFKI